MKTVHMLDDNDVRKEVEHVLSCCYEGDEWMEDGSIRQSIRNLQRLTDNHISVMANHDNKIQGLLTCVKTLSEMVEMLSKRVGIEDESE